MSRRTAQLRESAFLMLPSLLDGPLQGYDIIQLTAELSEGWVWMATGMLSAAPDHLSAEGDVNPVREEIVNETVRRSYGLTLRGASALEAEAESMVDAPRLVTEPSSEGEHMSPEGEAA